MLGQVSSSTEKNQERLAMRYVSKQSKQLTVDVDLLSEGVTTSMRTTPDHHL